MTNNEQPGGRTYDRGGQRTENNEGDLVDNSSPTITRKPAKCPTCHGEAEAVRQQGNGYGVTHYEATMRESVAPELYDELYYAAEESIAYIDRHPYGQPMSGRIRRALQAIVRAKLTKTTSIEGQS